MAETWPASVPFATARRDFQLLEPFLPPLQTDMERGDQRRRRSSTVNIAKVQVTIKMSDSQFEIFKAWVRDDLVDSSLTFTARVWTGSAFEERTCKFSGDGYTDTPIVGVDHRVSITLDVRDY